MVNIRNTNKPLGRIVSQKHLMSSAIQYSKWTDTFESIVVSDNLENIAAIIRMFSIKVDYTASWEKEPEGRLGGTPSITFEYPDAWSIFQPFNGLFCDSGTHHLPLFKGGPSAECLDSLEKKGFNPMALKNMIDQNVIKPLVDNSEIASIDVKVIDGNFNEDTFWSPKQELEHTELLLQVKEKKTSRDENELGKTWQDFVLNSLTAKERMKGTSSKKYIQVSFTY